jgi:hypothetical protein
VRSGGLYRLEVKEMSLWEKCGAPVCIGGLEEVTDLWKGNEVRK